MSDDRDDDLAGQLRQLPGEEQPPPALEESTVAALRRAGLLHDHHAPRPLMKWLRAAVLAIAAFGSGFLIARGSAPSTPAPTFALLLYGGSNGDDSVAHAARAAEYNRWATSPMPGGEVVAGEALGAGGIAVFRPDTSAFSGVAADVIDASPDELVGYFLVNAPNRQAALRMARDCPHLRYGGRVVVRSIRPT